MPSKANLYNNIKLLSEYNLKKYVLSKYNLQDSNIEQVKIKNTEKQRAVYKVSLNGCNYCLKKVYYDVEDLLFVYSAIEWFYRYDIKVPRILKTVDHNRFVEFENMLFILTPWVDGMKCDYDIEDHILKSIENLGKMHEVTENFHPIKGSNINENHADIYTSMSKHYEKLLKNSNSAFHYKDKFSLLYLDHFPTNERLGKISTLVSCKINSKNLKRSLCHLDYVNKNLLFDKNSELWVIDFDKCKIDYCAHDISYFLRRLLRRDSTSWDFEVALKCLETYEKNYSLGLDEYLYILSYLSFPQKYWRISRDYYNNINKCNKNSFQTLLNKAVKNEEKQLNFSLEFINYIEKNFKIKSLIY
ncbi:CotS family spore coat protein [Haloimpatiens sp. FM7315]|uniref:CotS family spore coat protein n=1 Tax=Haloimpatiens sp. FM7315 TaxID=3298609 RepID=UPI0035A2D955